VDVVAAPDGNHLLPIARQRRQRRLRLLSIVLQRLLIVFRIPRGEHDEGHAPEGMCLFLLVGEHQRELFRLELERTWPIPRMRMTMNPSGGKDTRHKTKPRGASCAPPDQNQVPSNVRILMRAFLCRPVATGALLLAASVACHHAAVPGQRNRPLLAVFAHPDDERVIGPLLSRLSREGRDVHLTIATDGSKGVRDHAGIPAGEPLAAARKLEAECAAKRLGVRQLHLLGLEDGGLASFPNLARLRTELTEVIARIQPAVIITFGPEGGTGHPDHRLVGNVVTQIVQSDERHRTIELLYASLPAERLRTAPPSSPTVNGVAEDLLTVRVPFERQDLVAGQEAFACHRSQYTLSEMAAINRTLAHVWNGTAYLRPWDGTIRDQGKIFGR
jgi:LmbE family N-acetylglucosaminyl deacetylase